MAKEIETKELVESQETATPEIVAEKPVVDNFDNIVAKISKLKDVEKYRGLRVKNVVVNLDDEDYDRITLVVNQNVRGNVREGDTYTIGETSNVYISSFALAAVLKQDENTAMLGNYVVRNPKVAENLLSGATISLLQQKVKAGEEYVNPFSTRTDAVPYVREWDWFANYITGIKLGVMGNKIVDRLIDRIVDEML